MFQKPVCARRPRGGHSLSPGSTGRSTGHAVTKDSLWDGDPGGAELQNVGSGHLTQGPWVISPWPQDSWVLHKPLCLEPSPGSN